MNVMFALFDMGGSQIILILALILIFFGARRIPELAKGLGQGIREFKKATREVTDEIHTAAEAPPPAPLQSRQVANGTAVSTPVEKPATVAQSTEPKA